MSCLILWWVDSEAPDHTGEQHPGKSGNPDPNAKAAEKADGAKDPTEKAAPEVKSDGTGPIPASTENSNAESKDDTKAKIAGWDSIVAEGIDNPGEFFPKAAFVMGQTEEG